MLAIECIKIGSGYPAFVNNQVAMEFLGTTTVTRGWTSRKRAPGDRRLPRDIAASGSRSLERDDLLDSGGRRQPTTVGVHFV